MVDFIELPLDRALTLYIAFPILIVLFFVFMLNILRRGEMTVHKAQILWFFSTNVAMMVVNISYAAVDSEFVQSIGNRSGSFLITQALSFLLVFALVIWKSDSIITRKIRIAIHLAIIGAALVYFTLPISFLPGYLPIWSPAMWIYSLCLNLALYLISLGVSIRVYKHMEDLQVRRRFLFFIVGVLLLSVYAVYMILANANLFGNLYLDVLVVPAGFFIYYGVGKKLST